MKDRTLVRTLRATAGIGGLSALVGTVILIIDGSSRLIWDEYAIFDIAFSLTLVVIVWLVARRQPRNGAVWALAAMSGFTGLVALGLGVAAALLPGNGAEILADPALVPVDLPSNAAWAITLTRPLSSASFLGMFTFGLLLFPDGTLLSPRWRRVTVLAAFGIGLTWITDTWMLRPSSTVQFNDPTAGLAAGLNALGYLAFMGAALLSVVSLISRFRSSEGDSRQQLKWIAWGVGMFVPAIIAGGVLVNTSHEDLPTVVVLSAGAAFIASYGIAVGKYHLYDVEVVISRTVVYGILLLSVAGFYVAAVVGIGGMLGGGPESNPWLSITATAAVALAFEPLRQRLQRLANRVVYGRRSTPYEVLSRFSANLTVSDESVLQEVARLLVDGTTADRACVWEVRDGFLERRFTAPSDTPSSLPDRVRAIADIPGERLVEPIVHDGETLGALSLSGAHGQALLPTDERLLRQLASTLGLALRNARLEEDLRRQVEELHRSRQRIVAVQDETRRRLERDLHDGAQQRLVAIRVKLGLAKMQAGAEGETELASRLGGVSEETERAIEALREFARGIHPPLLEAEGLGVALSSHASHLPLPVAVHADGVGRHPPSVEAAVFFCVVEALQNVVKHSGASAAHVSLQHSDGKLTFEVTDDGRGLEPPATKPRSGLANLVDRLDALDGTLELISGPGGGTTVRGVIPSSTGEARP